MIVFISVKFLKNIICLEKNSFYFYHNFNVSVRAFIDWTYIEAYLLQLVAGILVNHALGSLSKSVYRLVFPPLLQITRHVVLSTLMNINGYKLLHHCYILHHHANIYSCLFFINQIEYTSKLVDSEDRETKEKVSL